MTEQIYPIDRGKVLKVKRRYNAYQFFKVTRDKAERYELIDGKIYMMASPSVNHQAISGYIYRKLGNYLEGKTCRAFIAPLDVVLFEKSKETKDNSQNVFQPDIFVVCNSKKITKNRIVGAPDFIVEVVSPSNSEDDYIKKYGVYMECGVREYWIVNPVKKKILVYTKNKKELDTYTYTFDDKVKVNIFGDLEIDFKELNL